MRSSDCDILILPGLGGGSLDHWYTRWAKKLSTARRVEQRDFERPVRSEWVETVEKAARAATRPVVLVGHSLGAVTAAHAAHRLSNVAAAFLVTPPSPEKIRASTQSDHAFADVPHAPLGFPTLLVASRNDEWCSYERAEEYAAAWGATLADAGESGHINPESGHGPWPEGLMRFAAFLSKIPSVQ
jgi:hypothetical protein